MSVVYSLYDALVSIKVPDDKAKAVIDAMEREMMGKLATKADVEHLRLAGKADVEHLRLDIESMRLAAKADIENLRLAGKADVENLRLAGKADLEHVRDMLSRDILAIKADLTHMGASLSRDIAHVEDRVMASMKTGFAEFETRLTIRLGVLMAALIGIATTLVSAVQYFR